MNIGFDLDKVFIDYPQFIPDKIIDKLYKKKSNGVLLYRIPSKTEQLLRLLVHHPIFRAPIVNNIQFVKNLASKREHKCFLISSRFDFLEKRTNALIAKHEFNKIFDAMFFNFKNNQPHLFKNEVVRKLNIDLYVDDDLPLLEFVSNNNPNAKFFWLNRKESKPLGRNLVAIKNLSEMLA